jgi:hypothetical protein
MWNFQLEMLWPAFLLVAIPVLVVGLLARLRRFFGGPAEPLLSGDSGATYALSFLMVLPFFLVVSLVWVEAGYLLLAKVACNQAAHSAARSAAVWLPMGQAAQGESKVRLAARLALTPYGRTVSSNLPPEPEDWSEEEVYEQAEWAGLAYAMVSGESGSEAALAAKFTDAARRTTVQITADTIYDPALNPDGEVEVSILFQPQALIPGVSAIVQPSSLGKGYHTIQSRSVLPAEFPRNASRSLSIPYQGPR